MQDVSPEESPVDAPAGPEVAATEAQRAARSPAPAAPDPVDTPAPSSAEGEVPAGAAAVETRTTATEVSEPQSTSPEGADPTLEAVGEPGPAKDPTEARSGAEGTAEKRAKPPRKSGSGRRAATVADAPEPTTLVDLLLFMGRERNLEPIKRIVKGAKPTPTLTQEQLAAVRAATADDPSFAVPVAFLRAVLLSGPTKRALEQGLAIVEECLLARHLARSSDTDRPTPDRASDAWLLGWLVTIERGLATEARGQRAEDSENLARALVVLLAARDKILSANIPALLAKTDGKGPVEGRRVDGAEDAERALDALSFAQMASRDVLSHRALVAAARHIGEARAHAKRADLEKAALVQRCETTEERSRRLVEESAQNRAAVHALEKERDELQRALAQARADADRAKSTARELERSMEEVEARAAEERERNEQRRIDDSNAYEGLRALTSRNRRKDLELLAEAAAALEKDPPKPHVALDRVSLVVKAMEKEREALRTQDETGAAGAEAN